MFFIIRNSDMTHVAHLVEEKIFNKKQPSVLLTRIQK